MSPDSDLSNSLPSGLTRCLVIGRLEDLPAAWIERVRADRGSIESVSHPVIAFAEALRHEVADRLRPSFGLSRQESIAVLFVGAERSAELESFHDAIRAHAPEVGVWAVLEGSVRRLTAERASEQPPERPVERPATGPVRPPTLRLAGTEAEPEPPPPPPPAVADGPAEGPRPSLDTSVTPEEIEMLLSFFDADPDADPRDPEGRR